MSRLVYFGAMAAILLMAVPLSAQKNATVQQGVVDHVLVRGSGDALEVEIQTSSAPVSPDTQALTGPDRIVVDFPGMLPSAALRALKVNRGVLKGVRSGLFFNNPPITRIVLDLTGPQSYQISTRQNAVVVKLSSSDAAGNQVARTTTVGGVRLRDASLSSPANAVPRATAMSVPAANVRSVAAAEASSSNAQNGGGQSQPVPAVAVPVEPVKPPVTVTYEDGMLRIHAEKATLAQVLFEVHQKTQADIAIPAGAEREQVIADLGPAPARDVLADLLNGSSYNFVFVGNELALERVILTQRDSSRY